VSTIAEMSPSQIWSRYVRYIGAGAVATGGLITLVRSVPTMIESFRIGARQIRRRSAATAPRPAAEPRTDRDLPLASSASARGASCWCWPGAAGVRRLQGPSHRLLAAVLVAIFAFFFVTVASRIVGLVGVTSNPTSGMTIATLLATSSDVPAAGWTDDLARSAALTIGCVVAIAASIAGDTSQDLKTGFLLGATPPPAGGRAGRRAHLGGLRLPHRDRALPGPTASAPRSCRRRRRR
jgi:putative OPT family oligopeptide transporter